MKTSFAAAALALSLTALATATATAQGPAICAHGLVGTGIEILMPDPTSGNDDPNCPADRGERIWTPADWPQGFLV